MSSPGEVPADGSPPPPGPESAEQQAIVVHEDALDAACQAASRSIDQLIWSGGADVAKSVTLFGPGIVVLPLFGRVSGVPEHRCLAYNAHPKRAARGGLMDRIDFESKFGVLDPGRLVDELAGGRVALEKRLQAIGNDELHDEVVALQDWREKANGRLKTLEKRAAWAFLGMPPGSASSQSAIKKAFKKKALELHPDKGGDAERFQLLQEMKELLIVPTPKELEELEKEAKEREAEVEKAREKEKEREKLRKEKEAKEKEDGEDAEFSDFSSDSDYDVDEEFKKMFPDLGKKKKKPKKEEEEEGPEGPMNLQRGENFNRERHEAARRKLHRSFLEMWERAGRLAGEIERAQASSGGDALRQLRKFVDRFANLEVSKLKENDPKKAERIFRRFLEQGAEVLCAAGAVDPLATVSSVAMQVNYPLLAVAPSPELEQRCGALVEAIKALPAIFKNYVSSAEDVAIGRRAAAKASSFKVVLLVPEPQALRAGAELPGVAEVSVELPGGSTLGDLRAAALRCCSKELFQGFAPRLFCKGKFLAGGDGAPLADLAGLQQGAAVQCLPSNKVLRPQAPQAPQAGKAPGSRAPKEPAPAPAAPAEAPEAPKPAAPASVHKPSPELLAALGKGDQETDRKAAEDKSLEEAKRAAEARMAAERQAKEEVERKAAEDAGGGGEDEEWFDDFFSGAKKAAETEAEKKQKREEEKREEQRKAAKREEEEAARRQEEERQQRREAGKGSLEARLKAQKEAQEKAKKLEKEKKKLLESKKKTEAKLLNVRDLAQVKEPVLTVQKRKTGWDSTWSHPCAGEKRADGMAIFCYPCDDWIHIGEAFDHTAFELHCEKLHYGWID